MKATGIVRRIDDLGRVVVPKEIRRTLRIREGDPLEIFVDREGEVILKKYSPIRELSDFAKEYAEALYDSLGHLILICDRDSYIAATGSSKKEYYQKKVSAYMENVMEGRTSVLQNGDNTAVFIEGTEEVNASFAIGPIIAGGDPIGAVVILSKDTKLGEIEKNAAKIAANFFARQMEQ